MLLAGAPAASQRVVLARPGSNGLWQIPTASGDCTVADSLLVGGRYLESAGQSFYDSFRTFALSLRLAENPLQASVADEARQEIFREFSLLRGASNPSAKDSASSTNQDALGSQRAPKAASEYVQRAAAVQRMRVAVTQLTGTVPAHSRASANAITKALDPAQLVATKRGDGTTTWCPSFTISNGASTKPASGVQWAFELFGELNTKRSSTWNNEPPKVQESSSAERISVNVSITSVERITIRAGSWFSNLLVRTYSKDGPFVSAPKSSDWWGPSARAVWFPREVLIARGVTVRVMLPDKHYAELRTALRSQKGVFFGPLAIGGPSQLPSVRLTHEDNGILVSVRADTPLVLAVVAEQLGD